MKSRNRTIAIILIIVVAAAAVAAAVLLAIKAVPDKKEPETMNTQNTYTETTKETERPADEILNFVFLGIDKQENRSDVMMAISINKTQNRINVVSLLRDSKVMIEGCSVGTKLGYAYKWGGETLALNAINENYGTNLRKYISMQFEDMIAIVDAAGGVDIELTEEEAEHLNSIANGMGYTGEETAAGANQLNGVQAVSFARFRETDSAYGEFYRSHRQQDVIRGLYKKVVAMSQDERLAFLDVVMDNMKSNMFMDELSVLTEMDMSVLELNEYTIPDEEYEKDLWKGWEDTPQTQPSDPLLDDRQWLWIYDLDEAGKRLKEYIGEK